MFVTAEQAAVQDDDEASKAWERGVPERSVVDVGARVTLGYPARKEVQKRGAAIDEEVLCALEEKPGFLSVAEIAGSSIRSTSGVDFTLKGTVMNANWIADYERVSSNALTMEWFVSPLEYYWVNGKQEADNIFRAPATQNANVDQMIAPQLYQAAMRFDFRAKMMAYAFMREPIAETYALEIESGLMNLYGLDFMSCLAQWIYVVEGYCRQLFQVASNTNVKSNSWTIPTVGDVIPDASIRAVGTALGNYLDTVVYRSTNNALTTTLNRHLMLHGNLQNNAFYSQKNCLSVMFVLDALVFIEMVRNRHFPQIFQDGPGDAERIARRKSVYAYEMEHALQDPNILKLKVLDEHI